MNDDNRNDELKRNEQRRERQALLRLGTNNPKCIFCEERDPRCLELHHIAGEAFDKVTAIVCRNHHRKLSDMQIDHPRMIDTGCEPDLFEVVGRFLLGLADMLIQLVRVMREFGQKLITRAQSSNPEARS